MKIYEIQTDIAKCQIIQRDDHYELHDFGCKTMTKEWLSNDWYIFNPLDNKTHFYDTPGSTIIFDEFIRQSDLGTLLEMAGEILPIIIDRERFYFLNTLECINALDNKRTEYNYYEDGSRSTVINKYYFHENRLGGSPIFKIPETAKYQMLCFEGLSDPWDEFKGRYEELNLEGLEFIEIYDSEEDQK